MDVFPWSAFAHFGQSPQPSPTSLSHSGLDTTAPFCGGPFTNVTLQPFHRPPTAPMPSSNFSPQRVLPRSTSLRSMFITYCGDLAHKAQHSLNPTKSSASCLRHIPEPCALPSLSPFPQGESPTVEIFSLPGTGQASYHARLSSAMLFSLIKSSTFHCPQPRQFLLILWFFPQSPVLLYT